MELPEITYNAIPVEMPPKIRKRYRDIEKEFREKAAENPNILGAMSMKLRQYLQGGLYKMGGYEKIHTLKLDVLKELIDTSGGNSILAVIQFRFEIDLVRKYFKKDIPVIAGGTSVKESLHLMREWNQGSIPLLLCHPASMAHGLNLQTGGHIIVWLALTWSYESYHQLVRRLFRQGQKEAVIIHHVLMKGTVDERVLKALSKKENVQESLFKALSL